MRLLALTVGLIALAMALFLTVVPPFLRADSVVETFPVDPEILALPSPTSTPSATPTVTPPLTPTASPTLVRTRIPSVAVLQQGVDGYNGCVDTYIQYYLPDNNFCQNPELSLATTNKAVLLMRYDLTKLPAKAVGLSSASVVQEAKLGLFMIQGRADSVVGIYLPRREWDACAVTWNQPWQQSGADGPQDRQAKPWRELTTTKATVWLEFDVTELVQNWLRDPAGNYGLLLKSFENRWPAQYIFFSSDHPAVNSRPRLTIKYEPALPTPTHVVETATATPTVEATATPGQPLSPRVIEVRWQERMNIGNPYLIAVAFRPAATQALLPQSPLPYMLRVTAYLTAPAFGVVSQSPAEQALEDTAGSLSWSWKVTPRMAGSQPISLDLLFAWKVETSRQDVSTSAIPAICAEPGVWYRTKVVRVEKPLTTWGQLNMLRNGMVILGLMCIIGWYVLGRRQGRI